MGKIMKCQCACFQRSIIYCSAWRWWDRCYASADRHLLTPHHPSPEAAAVGALIMARTH